MKTAISVPDDTFERASRRAHELGISRSEFFSTAARHYLEELDAESTTAAVNQALAQLDVPDDSAADAVALSGRVLAAPDDAW